MANFKNPSPKTIVKMAREKILDESMNDAIVFLMDCLDGMDVHTARQILLGHWNITEDFDFEVIADFGNIYVNIIPKTIEAFNVMNEYIPNVFKNCIWDDKLMEL